MKQLPDWAPHALFWHVYPLGFCDCPIWQPDRSLQPRLEHLEAHLDYLLELGLNGLLLGPVFQSQTHGYDTLDYFTIDPRLGTNEDMARLLSACKTRGIRVLFDGVFSHASTHCSHPELLHAEEVFEGHSDLRRLDHSNPATSAFVLEVMRYWLDQGIDGWRLDAAYSVSNEFWQPILESIHQEYPDALILGEVIHGDYPGIITASGMDTLTQYELWKAIWSSLKDENFYELDWNLTRHNTFLDTFVPQTFIGNHDVTRILTQVGPEKALLAAIILFTVGGIPSMYYGDEQAYEGLKEERFGGDDAIRPAFSVRDTPLAHSFHETYRALIALRRKYPWLYHARTEVTQLENQLITYRTFDDEQELFVHLDLDSKQGTIADAFGTVLFST